MIAYLDAHREEFGVEPICRTITEVGCAIAPSTYYAAKSRPPSARADRDAEVLPLVIHAHSDREAGRGLYGARKVWPHLRRKGHQVPRCQVERLMRQAGLRGVRRGRQFISAAYRRRRPKIEESPRPRWRRRRHAVPQPTVPSRDVSQITAPCRGKVWEKCGN